MAHSPSTAAEPLVHPSRPFLRERLGAAVGSWVAPLVRARAARIHARVLHADGVVFSARVEPAPALGVLAESVDSVGKALRGPAIVRFSAAFRRDGAEGFDVLGCAVRFRSDEDPARVSVEPGDQDLLFSTNRSPFTMIASLAATDSHDFLGNDYFGSAPFDVPGVGRAKWKLVPARRAAMSVDDDGRRTPRTDRLRAEVARGGAALVLRLRSTWTPAYVTVGRIELLAPIDVDPQELRFSPFVTGRGIEPRGFVQALRRPIYAASQSGRSAAAR